MHYAWCGGGGCKARIRPKEGGRGLICDRISLNSMSFFFRGHMRTNTTITFTHSYELCPMTDRILSTSILTVSSVRTPILTLYLDPLPSFVNGE